MQTFTLNKPAADAVLQAIARRYVWLETRQACAMIQGGNPFWNPDTRKIDKAQIKREAKERGALVIALRVLSEKTPPLAELNNMAPARDGQRYLNHTGQRTERRRLYRLITGKEM